MFRKFTHFLRERELRGILVVKSGRGTTQKHLENELGHGTERVEACHGISSLRGGFPQSGLPRAKTLTVALKVQPCETDKTPHCHDTTIQYSREEKCMFPC